MEKVWDIANLYVATLRAIYLIEQHCHWTSHGDPFYSNHLLFERLYQSAQKNADTAAERFVGLFGLEALNYKKQCDLMYKVMEKYADLEDKPFEQALAIEKDFLSFAEKAFKELESEKVMTLGIDDFFTEVSSDRETACYLLGQTLKTAKIAQAQNADLKGYLDRALAAAVANAGISSTFYAQLNGTTYTMSFTPALDQAKKTQLLTNLNNFIKANRPQLAGQITFTFSQ